MVSPELSHMGVGKYVVVMTPRKRGLLQFCTRVSFFFSGRFWKGVSVLVSGHAVSPHTRSFLLVVGASFGSLMSVDPYFQGLFFVAQPTGGTCPRVCVVCVRGLEQRANHSNHSR